MNVVVVTPADTLPCSIDLALRHVRALTDEVDLVDLACRAATAACEDYTGRVFVQQVFCLQLGGWPDTARSDGINRPAPHFKRQCGIALPRSPLVAISSVKYYPEDGGAQDTLGAGLYRADLGSLHGRLVFKENTDLPSVASRPDAIEITFTAGHGTKEYQMPANYLMCMLQLARHFYDNPSAVDMSGTVRRMPFSFQHLLRSQKI